MVRILGFHTTFIVLIVDIVPEVLYIFLEFITVRDMPVGELDAYHAPNKGWTFFYYPYIIHHYYQGHIELDNSYPFYCILL